MSADLIVLRYEIYKIKKKLFSKFVFNNFKLEKEFFSQLDNPLLGKAFKLAIIGEWLAANSLDVNLFYFKIKIF